jgi:hypothetical protein
MNVFMGITWWIPVSLTCLQLLAWLNGEYAGEPYEKYREVLHERLILERPDATASLPKKSGYLLRKLIYSFYLWPFRFMAVNLSIIAIHLVANHYLLTY